MHHPVAAAVVFLAALSTSADAQPYWVLDDTGNHDGVIDASAGESAVLAVWGTCPSETVGFARSLYQVAGDANWRNNGLITFYDNLLDSLTNDGVLGAGNTVTAIDSYQLPPVSNPNFVADNPIELYRILWRPTVLGSYTVSVTSTHTTHDWYSDTSGTTFSCTPPYSPTVTFRVIPAPGPGTLLPLLAIPWFRRHREG